MHPQRYLFSVPIIAMGLMLLGLAMVPSTLPARPAPEGWTPFQGLTIVTSGPAQAGAVNCVTVVPVGPPKAVAVRVEINGVEVPVISLDHRPDGTVSVCYPVPAASTGGTVTVTATSGGSSGVSSVPVAL